MNICKKRSARSGIAMLALAAGIATAPAANAQFVQELDFQIHLGNAVAGLGNLTGLSVLGYTGGFQTTPTGGSGTGLVVGDTGQVDVVGNITSCEGVACVTDAGKVLGLDYELTFFSRTRTTIVVSAPPNFNADNTPAGDTVLELYVDTSLDAVPIPDPASGAGGGMAGPVRDPAGDPTATLIATFQLIQPGTGCGVAIPLGTGCDGTVFNALTLDGSVDSTYRLVSDPFGVFFKSDGVTPLPLLLTLAATDTNSDLDPDNNGVLDTTYAAGPFGGTCTTGVFGNGCGTVDGSVIVATEEVRIPEPGAVAMLGIGLAVFAFGFGARRRSRPAA